MAGSSRCFFIIFVVIIGNSLKNSNTIVVPDLENERIEDPANRELINIATEIATYEFKGLSKSVSCLTSFLNTYMSLQMSQLSVLLVNVNDGDVNQVYISEIHQDRPIYIVTDGGNVSTTHSIPLDALLIVKNHEDLEYSEIRLIHLCGTECRYALILTTLYNDMESFMEEAQHMVRVLWIKKIANIAILGTVGDTLYAAKSMAFKFGVLREPMEPILAGYCHDDFIWKTTVDLYAPMAMNYSFIDIGVFDQEPYVILKTIDNETTAEGMEVWILRVMGKRLHFIGNASLIPWADSHQANEVLNAFENNTDMDIVIGGILWDPSDDIDFSQPYDVVQIVWVIPKYDNISLRGLITPLSDLVWFAVCGVLLLAIFLRIILFRDITFLEILALLIGFAWHKQPITNSSRLYFMAFVLFGYVLNQFYLASLAGQLMAQADLQMETMVELMDSGLHIGGTQTHKMMFNFDDNSDTNNDDGSNDLIKNIFRKFIVLNQNEYDQQLHHMVEGTNLTMALTMTLNVSSMETTISKKNVHIMSEVVASYPLAFAVWRGLPYLNQIDDVVNRLVQAGITSHFGARAAMLSDPVRSIDEEETNLDLNDIVPAFLLLIMGYLVSIVCFIVELIIMKIKQRNTKIKQKKQNILLMKKRRRVIKHTKKKNIVKPKILRPNVTVSFHPNAHHQFLWKEF